MTGLHIPRLLFVNVHRGGRTLPAQTQGKLKRSIGHYYYVPQWMTDRYRHMPRRYDNNAWFLLPEFYLADLN
jgi:hypothetical protein